MSDPAPKVSALVVGVLHFLRISRIAKFYTSYKDGPGFAPGHLWAGLEVQLTIEPLTEPNIRKWESLRLKTRSSILDNIASAKPPAHFEYCLLT